MKSSHLIKKGIFSSVFLVLIIIVLSSVPSFLDHTFLNTAQAHTATIPVGIAPYDIKYDPNNNNIYVANAASSTVSVISGSTNSVVATTLVGWFPVWLVHVPSNNKIYVTNEDSNDVYVINAATNKVVKAIPVGSFPFGIAYDPTNNSVYVTNLANNTVSVINAATDVVVSTIPLGTVNSSTNPILLTYVKDNDALYVSKYTQEVSVINAVTNAAVNYIKVDGNPACS
jgi:YVTN family beta-propeller protein